MQPLEKRELKYLIAAAFLLAFFSPAIVLPDEKKPNEVELCAEGKKCDKKVADEEPISLLQTELPPATEEPPQAAAYRLGVGDVLEISVWRNSDLDKNVIVRPDGVISYPLIGDVQAVGLTLSELDDRVTQALRDYVRNPVVSVAVQRFGGAKIIVMGAVKSPGIYSPAGGGNVMDVIALAGGFDRGAVQRGTFLVRGGLANPQVYRLNLARVFKGDLSQNISLQSNDIVFVPKTFLAKWNDVLAQIAPTLTNMLLGTSVTRDLQNLTSTTPTTP